MLDARTSPPGPRLARISLAIRSRLPILCIAKLIGVKGVSTGSSLLAGSRHAACLHQHESVWIDVSPDRGVDLLARQRFQGLRVGVEPAYIVAALSIHQDGLGQPQGRR